MDVSKYINELLYRHNCVIIPGFGGFITNNIGAVYNANDHFFYPPTKQLSFNSHLKHNDGLLADYIAVCMQISFDEAVVKIEEAVRLWENQLKNQPVAIGYMGVLQQNKEGQLLFEQDNSTNFLPASFGLCKIETSLVTRNTAQVKPLVPVVAHPKKAPYRALKYAAGIAIIAVLGFAGYTANEKQKHNKLLAEKEQLIQEQIQSATFVISDPLPSIQLNVKRKSDKDFHVVAGAFKVVENAEKKVVQLKKKGFDAKIIGKNKWGLTTVTYGSYETRRIATNALNKIKRTVSKDAWLYIKK